MGLDKNQNAGPYSNNGFRKDPQISHLDFMEGEVVEFVGQSEKTKNKRGIPNGSMGTILDKSTMKNKHMKLSRSELFVDFDKHGTRIVRKELLRFPDDHEDQLDELVDTQGSMQGYQDYTKEMIRKEKNRLINELLFVSDENEEVSLEKLREFNEKVNTIHKKIYDNKQRKNILKQDKINQTLTNRENNKKYRTWRQEFLHKKYIDLQQKVNNLYSSPEYKHKRVLKNKLVDEIDELTDKYTPTNEPVTKSKFMETCSESDKEPEKLYHYKKDKDVVRIKYLKQELLKVQLYLKESTKDIHKLSSYMDSPSRQYIPEVSDRTDYLKYLHYHYEGGSEYKYEDPKPSREYTVDPNMSVEKDNDIKLFQWGLNPQDVD
jgi:hypothetical protein